MKYYRVNIKGLKIVISCGNDMPTKEFMNNQIYELLNSLKVNINRNETFEFQDSNEKEFEDLKREVALNSNFKMRY